MAGDEAAKAEIIALIGRINRSWRTGHTEALMDLFHEDALIVQPGFEKWVKGRERCVASYAEFAAAGTVHSYDESDHRVDLWGNTAVATYRFRIDFEVGGERYLEAGLDLLVFSRFDDSWQVVWRTPAPLPESAATD